MIEHWSSGGDFFAGIVVLIVLWLIGWLMDCIFNHRICKPNSDHLGCSMINLCFSMVAGWVCSAVILIPIIIFIPQAHAYATIIMASITGILYIILQLWAFKERG